MTTTVRFDYEAAANELINAWRDFDDQTQDLDDLLATLKRICAKVPNPNQLIIQLICEAAYARDESPEFWDDLRAET